MRHRPEELPEQVLAAARMTYVDFANVRPFPADMLDSGDEDYDD